jgi:hypothetical protein
MATRGGLFTIYIPARIEPSGNSLYRMAGIIGAEGWLLGNIGMPYQPPLYYYYRFNFLAITAHY